MNFALPYHTPELEKKEKILESGKMTYIRWNYKMENLESQQTKAALAVTGSWKGTNWDKLIEELGW